MSEEEETRCSIPGTLAEVDYGRTGASAKGYLERMGVLDPSSPPGPMVSFGTLRVHGKPLKPPLPLPAFQRPLLGEKAPDRGQTLPWPYPDPPE